MNLSSSSLRLLVALFLALASCAPEARDVEDHDAEQAPSAVIQSDASEPAAASDAALADAAPYFPCSSFAVTYRSEESARKVADAWPGRLTCVYSVNDEGASVGWSVIFGSDDCKCQEPIVENLPPRATTDAGS